MPIYLDLYQQDLSLVTLQKSLATGEEMVITHRTQPIARILSISPLTGLAQDPQLNGGERVNNHRPMLVEKRSQYDFSDLIGRLQWQGNALTEQQRLRDEW